MSNKIVYEFECGDYFDYEVPDDEVKGFRTAVLTDMTREQLVELINDLVDDDAFFEYMYDTAFDTFYYDAQEQYNDWVASQNPYDYYMIRRNDIDGV